MEKIPTLMIPPTVTVTVSQEIADHFRPILEANRNPRFSWDFYIIDLTKEGDMVLLFTGAPRLL